MVQLNYEVSFIFVISHDIITWREENKFLHEVLMSVFQSISIVENVVFYLEDSMLFDMLWNFYAIWVGLHL